MKGEFEATSSIYSIANDFSPEPITYGTFQSIPDSHYYICKFYELAEELPEKDEFCEKLAALHSKSQSPNGKFGFHVVTYNGDLPQKNDYTDTWEEFFISGFNHMLAMNIERGGTWEAMESLRLDMLTKVIPRLLRPMETDGRTIKPSLVHGDLWCGNAAIDTENDRPLIYDPASFYAHNECKAHLPVFKKRIIDQIKTKWATGDQNETSFREVTSTRTILTFPSLFQKKTTMIGMLCMQCKSQLSISFRNDAYTH